MLKRLITVSPLVAMIAIVATWAPTPLGWHSQAAAQGSVDTEMVDQLLLDSGRVIRGRIIEETETYVLFEIRMDGLPPVRQRYQKSEISAISRDVDSDVAEVRDIRTRPESDDTGEVIDPDATLIYEITITGKMGEQVSTTPMEELFADINEVFDDAVPNPATYEGGPETVVDEAVRDKHIVIMNLDVEKNFEGFDVFGAMEIVPTLEREIHDRGRRVIFVVKNAHDVAAFMPWISDEIYFRPDGEMRFFQDLDRFDTGDDVVDEKLIGAQLGRAQGFAMLGGYTRVGPPIIKAMARSHYWLSALWTGSEPKLTLRVPTKEMLDEGWEILSDNGRGPYQDTVDQFVRNKTNDQLVLRPDIAFRLGVSDGTVEDTEELLFMLGVHRNHHFVKHEGDKVMGDWKSGLARAIKLAHPGSERARIPQGELWKELFKVRGEGARDFNEARKNRGRQLTILKRIRSLVLRYAEVMDPGGQMIIQIESQIYSLEVQQQIANENR